MAYTDPEIAWAGSTEDELKERGEAYGKAVFPWSASGRAIANGREDGFVKLLFDKTTGRTLELDMTAAAHFMHHDYLRFNGPLAIRPPG